ncbi:MAG: hypothetical protein ACRD4P_11860 [Bryobacteraceae bacterium]
MLFVALAGCFSAGRLVAQSPPGSAYTVTGTIKDLRPNGDVAFMDKFVRGVRADGSQAVSMTPDRDGERPLTGCR